jgi:predicted amidohydrolase
VPRAHSLAAAQTIPVRGNVDANVAEHLRVVRRAAEEGVEVLAFPELSLTGYEPDLGPSLAFTLDDPRLTPLVEAAVASRLTLLTGAPVRLDGELHIGALILCPDGSVDVYTKRHLGAFGDEARVDGTPPPPEATFFRPGSRDPLVAFGERRAAVAVCSDTGRPSHAKAAAERGVAVYLASMFVTPSDYEGDSARLKRYAIEHAMAVVFSNYGGPTGGLRSAGRSAVWSPTGERVAELDATGLGIALAVEEHGSWHGRAIRIE